MKMNTPKRRVSSKERREQIINAAIFLIAEKGIQGTTMGRIADMVGVSEPALYRHFKNRRAVLIAVLDSVSDLVRNIFISFQGNALDQIRLASSVYYALVVNKPEASRVFFEFICASPGEDLSDHLQEKISEIIALVEGLIMDGLENGLFQQGIDVTVTAWEIFSHGLTLNFASILGFNNILTQDRAMAAVESILNNIKK